MNAHTPGPWVVVRKSSHFSIVAADNTAVTRMSWYAIPREACQSVEESRANANLISAAPDLLAALQGVLLVADRQTDEFDAARAAIAKAIGEKS